VMLCAGYLLINSLTGSGFTRSDWAVALFFIAQFVIFTFYHLFFEFIWNGQTPGKRRLSIRVVQANGLPLTTSGLLIRNFVRLLDFLPILYGVGLVTMFFTKNTQRLGDLAARTIVIREHKQLTVRTLQEDFSVHYRFIPSNQIARQPDLLPDTINLNLLTQADRRTIVDYLQRRADLTSRDLVATGIARKIARKMDAPDQFRDRVQADTFLEQVAFAFELTDRRLPLADDTTIRIDRS